jgi:hypothetical protein
MLRDALLRNAPQHEADKVGMIFFGRPPHLVEVARKFSTQKTYPRLPNRPYPLLASFI